MSPGFAVQPATRTRDSAHSTAKRVFCSSFCDFQKQINIINCFADRLSIIPGKFRSKLAGEEFCDKKGVRNVIAAKCVSAMEVPRAHWVRASNSTGPPTVIAPSIRVDRVRSVHVLFLAHQIRSRQTKGKSKKARANCTLVFVFLARRMATERAGSTDRSSPGKRGKRMGRSRHPPRGMRAPTQYSTRDAGATPWDSSMTGRRAKRHVTGYPKPWCHTRSRLSFTAPDTQAWNNNLRPHPVPLLESCLT